MSVWRIVESLACASASSHHIFETTFFTPSSQSQLKQNITNLMFRSPVSAVSTRNANAILHLGFTIASRPKYKHVPLNLHASPSRTLPHKGAALAPRRLAVKWIRHVPRFSNHGSRTRLEAKAKLGSPRCRGNLADSCAKGWHRLFELCAGGVGGAVAGREQSSIFEGAPYGGGLEASFASRSKLSSCLRYVGDRPSMLDHIACWIQPRIDS